MRVVPVLDETGIELVQIVHDHAKSQDRATPLVDPTLRDPADTTMSAAHKIQPGESVASWVDRQPRARLVEAVRERLLSLGLVEAVKWSQPWYTRRDNVAYLSSRPDYVTLGLCRGAHLDDPKALLDGTGKDMRHVKVYDAEALDNPSLERLLRAAIEYDEAHDRAS